MSDSVQSDWFVKSVMYAKICPFLSTKKNISFHLLWLLGAVSIARRLKVSDFVIGAAIVGVGTSMPELVVSFIGALQGNADVCRMRFFYYLCRLKTDIWDM